MSTADLLVILSDIEGYYDSHPRENTKAKTREKREVK